MRKNLAATATVSIAADKSQVWDALVTPAAIKQYMFGAVVQSDWKVGSTITWSGEMKGKKYEDRGEILRFDPPQTLAYSHFSPMSGKPDQPENHHTVIIQLSGTGYPTNVFLSQDNNPDEKSKAESARNWSVMLEGLKEYVESAYRLPQMH
jgi:uncharacterized protein YndB with AHSA1/START domain